jgi:hypothetical protein
MYQQRLKVGSFSLAESHSHLTKRPIYKWENGKDQVGGRVYGCHVVTVIELGEGREDNVTRPLTNGFSELK